MNSHGVGPARRRFLASLKPMLYSLNAMGQVALTGDSSGARQYLSRRVRILEGDSFAATRSRLAEIGRCGKIKEDFDFGRHQPKT
jgi:hypothetical protein